MGCMCCTAFCIIHLWIGRLRARVTDFVTMQLLTDDDAKLDNRSCIARKVILACQNAIRKPRERVAISC